MFCCIYGVGGSRCSSGGHDLSWDLWLIGQAHALLVCDPWDNLLWALGFIGLDDALLVYNPGDNLLWVLGLGLNVREGGIVLPRLLWDSGMNLGYGGVGVIRRLCNSVIPI